MKTLISLLSILFVGSLAQAIELTDAGNVGKYHRALQMALKDKTVECSPIPLSNFAEFNSVIVKQSGQPAITFRNPYYRFIRVFTTPDGRNITGLEEIMIYNEQVNKGTLYAPVIQPMSRELLVTRCTVR